jgi:poly-gamma-glutamate synthesis protein (capsule biosynthesis protein)
MLGRSVNQGIISRHDASWPLRGLFSITKPADIVFGNLESPLIGDCPNSNSGFKFCGQASNVAGLVDAGVDVLGIANNHAENYGPLGIEETITNLSRVGIGVVGTSGDPVIILKGGSKFAFFAANDVGGTSPTINSINQQFLDKISASKGRGEIVIVGIHWGQEYTHTPSTRQEEVRKQLLAAGATIIVGHHPHWTQPTVLEGNTLTMYSLGNTVFDQEWSKETKEGILVEVKLTGNKIDSFREIPVYLKNFGEASTTKEQL